MKERIFTIPNIVTMLGIVFVFTYVFAFFTDASWFVFPALFLAGLSDLIDGYLARKLSQSTKLGELLDPTRDKLLTAAVAINIIFTTKTEVLLNHHFQLFLAAEIIFILINVTYYCLRGQKLKTHMLAKLKQAVFLVIAGLFIDNLYSPRYLSFIPIKMDLAMMSWLLFATSGIALIGLLINLKKALR